jgi:hypothetical protein
VQANKHPAPTDSYSGDELVKKERTGSLVEILDVKLQYSVVSVDDDSIYQILHELGGSKAYENMRFHHLDQNSSSFMSSSIFCRQIRPFQKPLSITEYELESQYSDYTSNGINYQIIRKKN